MYSDDEEIAEYRPEIETELEQPDLHHHPFVRPGRIGKIDILDTDRGEISNLDIKLAVDARRAVRALADEALDLWIERPQIGAVVVLLYWCFSIVSPFLSILAWGLIIGVALYPVHRALTGRLGGRATTSVTILVLLALAIIIAPSWYLAESSITALRTIAGPGVRREKHPTAERQRRRRLPIRCVLGQARAEREPAPS